jgi:hypothetical protein
MQLTETEKQRLRSTKSSSAGGRSQYAGHQPDIDLDSDEPVEYDHRNGRGTVTVELCNAIRCAAHDGVSYARIAEMFGPITDRKHAQKHAAGGHCNHDGIEPVSSNPGGTVDASLCATLRAKWKRGEISTYREAAQFASISPSTAYSHINDECNH